MDIAAPPSVRYFHGDCQGSVMAVTTGSASLLSKYRYDPWGRRSIVTGAANGLLATRPRCGPTRCPVWGDALRQEAAHLLGAAAGYNPFRRLRSKSGWGGGGDGEVDTWQWKIRHHLGQSDG
jgi:hypothetical protein